MNYPFKYQTNNGVRINFMIRVEKSNCENLKTPGTTMTDMEISITAMV